MSSDSLDNPEVISVLCNVDNRDWMTIEIESSLPLRIQGEHKNPEAGLEIRDLLNGMIQTLEYLLRLQDAGFSLDIIGQDCMWTAYLEFNDLPDQDFFNLLIP